MKIISEKSITEFEAWSGAVDTKQRIEDADKAEEFDTLIEELYPDGIDETALNDLLWFEDEWIFDTLGIKSEDEEPEDDEA